MSVIKAFIYLNLDIDLMNAFESINLIAELVLI